MSKLNIANYFVYDIANKFNCLDAPFGDKEITGMVADAWNKKHFVSGIYSTAKHHEDNLTRNFLI